MPSLLSRIVERLVLLSGTKREFASEEALRQSVARRRKSGPALPSAGMRRHVAVSETAHNGSRVFSIRPLREQPGKHVLYLHGGAHVIDILPFHWILVSRLVRHSGCAAVVPLYPLAPEHNCKDTLDMLRSLFERLVAQVGRENLIVMGDSAGGNLALALAQQLRDAGRPVPARLILVSPGLDLTFSDPRQRELAKHDCLLDIPGLKAAGRWYAGDLSPADPRVSSLFGSLAGLPPIAVFTGTRDLVNPDAHRLKAKAAQDGASVSLHEYEGMFHVWPAAPIREARQAIGEMKWLIWNTPEK
jgi:monoterpene epsilon-lactone hydrolase